MGEATIGTYVAYGAIVLFLLLVVALFLRFAATVSLLLLSPGAALLRRLRGRPLLEGNSHPEESVRGEPPS